MTPDQIDAMLMPLRVWLIHAGYGERGERARAHLDALRDTLTEPTTERGAGA